MCNLSEGIYERAAVAEREKIVLKLLENGIKLSIIAGSSGPATERIEQIARKNHLSIVY